MKKMLDERYMVHDELLYELYSLRLDTIKYEIINGIPYLTNIVDRGKFQIGFRVRMDSKLDDRVESGTFLNQIDGILDDGWDFKFEIGSELKSKYCKFLCLSNIEKYLMNIFLDKYLDNYYNCFITLKEIEINYRSTAMSYRNITLNEETFNRYLNTIDLLQQKELYIKTNSNFRKPCYGVNNLEVSQSLLKIINFNLKGSHNLELFYSFGILGKIIYNCKRYSTIATAHAFKVNLNQVKRNLVAMWLARKVYIERGMRAEAINPKLYYEINIDEVMNFANDALTPIESNYERYKNSIGKMICRILFYMKKENYIYDYKYEEQDKKVLMKEEKGNSIEEILANYYEEPRYVTKYEKEYDIKVFFSPTYSKYEIINYGEELFNPDRIKI